MVRVLMSWDSAEKKVFFLSFFIFFSNIFTLFHLSVRVCESNLLLFEGKNFLEAKWQHSVAVGAARVAGIVKEKLIQLTALFLVAWPRARLQFSRSFVSIFVSRAPVRSCCDRFDSFPIARVVLLFFFLLEDELMSCLLNRLSLECLDNNWFFKMFDRSGHHLTDFSWACKNVKSASPKITKIPVKSSKIPRNETNQKNAIERAKICRKIWAITYMTFAVTLEVGGDSSLATEMIM